MNFHTHTHKLQTQNLASRMTQWIVTPLIVPVW